MSLEDVFIAIVDQTAANKNRYDKKDPKKGQKRRGGDIEQDIAKTVIENTDKKKGGEFSALFGDDEEER